MARTRLEEYDSYPWQVELEIRVSDLNYGGHLAYDRLFGLVHEARIRFLEELGVTEMDLGDGKTGLVVADACAVYLGEGRMGDVLVIKTRPVDVTGGSFRLAHRISKKNGDKVALVETGCAAFDYINRRPTRLPPSLSVKLNGYNE